jgi:hypothetical protein
MNTPAQNDPKKQQTLLTHIRRWDDRLRYQQIVAWLGRVLIAALMTGIMMAIISRMRFWLTNEQVAMSSALLMGLYVTVLILVVRMWPRSPLRAARHFDRQFGLQERVSTALELLEGRIHTVDALAEHQIADAAAHAETVDAAEHLPFRVRVSEWGLIAGLLLALIILVLIPNDQTTAATTNVGLQQAIGQTAEDVREAIEDVAADTGLTDQDREDLLESLQASLETLQDEDISVEEAMATTSDVQTVLEDKASDIGELTDEQLEALAEAAEMMRNMESEQEEPPPLSEQVSTMADNLEGVDFDSLETAEDLERAADALENIAPDVAEALRDAAKAMREGDMEAAAEALRDASERLERMQNENERAQLSQEQLERMAEQMQQDRDEIGERSEENSDSEEGSSNSEQQGEAEGDAPPESGEQARSGDQPGGEDASSSSSPGDSSQLGDPQTEDGPPGEDGSANQGSSSAADPNTDTTGATGDAESDGGSSVVGGEREYEEVFAPQYLELEEGDDVIGLETGEGDLTVRERDRTENPEGAAIIPYNQVYSDYANSANAALDQSYIPLGLRDVVREYFTSLAPQGADAGN